jgi:dTDP-glucose pyrophosphorylase
MMNIVIPMAGHGSRFTKAGYRNPKPLIDILGKPMIQWVTENLKPKMPHRFIFICQKEHLAFYSLGDLLESLAPGCEIIEVSQVTQGAACTVLLAKQLINNQYPLMIANCDQYIDIDINEYLQELERTTADGLIMTMKAHDPKWSFIKLNANNEITEVVEKKVVSDEATVGIYNYKHGSDFVTAAEMMIRKDLRVNNEFYVAPAYNEMIADGKMITFFNIGSLGVCMHGLGTPEDLDDFISCSKRISNHI